MPRTPDARDGPLYEEAIIFDESTSDPTVPRELRYVQDKGLVILEDGVVRGAGEGRDNVWQPPVDDRDVDTPPGSPVVGYRVIVGSSPTGDFVGHEGELAQWNGTEWVFAVPKEGTVIYVKDEAEPYKQTASSTPWIWALVNTTSGGALPPATEVGQFLFSYNGTTFEIVKPVMADDGFIVTDDDGHMVVTETP